MIFRFLKKVRLLMTKVYGHCDCNNRYEVLKGGDTGWLTAIAEGTTLNDTTVFGIEWTAVAYSNVQYRRIGSQVFIRAELGDVEFKSAVRSISCSLFTLPEGYYNSNRSISIPLTLPYLRGSNISDYIFSLEIGVNGIVSLRMQTVDEISSLLSLNVLGVSINVPFLVD